MSKVVIAPDSFKASATSIEVAAAIAQGWKSLRPSDELIQIPFADGGEGTLLVLEKAQPSAQRIYCPDISPAAYWLLLDDATAVVELAQVSGITLLAKLNPMGAHTFAFGQLLADATKHRQVERIYAALGGSASTDAGVGALMALGFEFLDCDGLGVGLGGGEISRIATIVSAKAVAPPKGGVIVLADVQSPLLGIKGAAAVFAPQKGAIPDQVLALDEALSHFVRVTGHADSAGSGAAGGTAFGLCALWGAVIRSGAENIAELSGLNSAISGADLIITGEGRLDSQSFSGKVVGHISTLAVTSGIPIAYCVGSIEGDFPASSRGGISLSQLAGSTEEAMKNTEKFLIEAGMQLTHLIP